MGISTILIGAVGSLVVAVLWDELKAWAPRLSGILTKFASRRAPRQLRSRLSEEWDAHIADTPGHLSKLVVAVGFVFAALKISQEARLHAKASCLPLTRSVRILDVAIASAALIYMAPVWLLFAAAIKLSSKGPVLYAQPRVGVAGRTIYLYKFRTMFADASGSNHFSLGSDPSVTKLGKFLRRTEFDQLPQLLNVVRGDLSLVGPKPLAAHEQNSQMNMPGIFPSALAAPGPVTAGAYLRSLVAGIVRALIYGLPR